jgi:hypothetical protein
LVDEVTDEENNSVQSKCGGLCCFCTRNKCCTKSKHKSKSYENHLHHLNQLKILTNTTLSSSSSLKLNKQKQTTFHRISIQNNAKYSYTFAVDSLKLELDKLEATKLFHNNNNNSTNAINKTNLIARQQELLTRLVVVEKCKVCKKFLRSHSKLFQKTLNSNLITSANTPATAATELAAENGSVMLQYSQLNGVRERLNTTLTSTSTTVQKDHKLFKKNMNTCSFCCCCCCCCLPCGLKKMCQTSRFCLLCDSSQEKLKAFVDGRLFQRAILFAILINTLSMGVEHHLQV